MPVLNALLSFALLHLSVSAAAAGSASTVKLGCLSAAPSTADSAPLSSDSASLTTCTDLCTDLSSPYAFYQSSSSSCWCGAGAAENTLYVDGVDHEANCGGRAVWYTGIINGTIPSDTTTTCPSLGPTSSAQLPGYTYLSTFPDPLACHSACEAADLDITLLQPGLGGYSCACAKDIEGEMYREVCNSQSWYVIESEPPN